MVINDKKRTKGSYSNKKFISHFVSSKLAQNILRNSFRDFLSRLVPVRDRVFLFSFFITSEFSFILVPVFLKIPDRALPFSKL